MSSLATGKRGQWVSCKDLYYVIRYLCKIDYATEEFIATPTFSYNEVVCLLELVGVVEQAKCHDSVIIHLIFMCRSK